MRLAPRRTGFTLLEVLLSTSIGLILLTAVYVAVDIHYKHTQAARNVVEQSTLARSLLARMSSDIAASMGPTDPSRFRAGSGQATGQPAAGAGTTGTGTTGQTGQTGTTGQTGQATSQQPTTQTQTQTGATSQVASSNFTFTVKGDSETLSIFVTRYPRELSPTMAQSNQDSGPPVVSDIRRISYWIAAGPPAGLARQELKIATSDDIDNLPPNINDEGQFVIAEEVKSVEFSYFDGTTWQESWDGGSLGADGMTPIGPPLAISIKIGLPKNSAAAGADGSEPELKYYRHVIALLTANGSTQVSTGDATTP